MGDADNTNHAGNRHPDTTEDTVPTAGVFPVEDVRTLGYSGGTVQPVGDN